MSDINCPHCGEAQRDCHNGGDPGPWWSSNAIPDGEIRFNCDWCNEEFIIVIEWSPTFEAREIGEDDEQRS